MEIKNAKLDEAEMIAKLAIKMWKLNTEQELVDSFKEYMQDEKSSIFLAWDKKEAIGFAQCGLRNDYVEGTESSPVGYLEGVFVAEEYRKKGVAKALLSACQGWARDQDCSEFASDCELENEESLAFHLKMGFEEANRIICFTKKL